MNLKLGSLPCRSQKLCCDWQHTAGRALSRVICVYQWWPGVRWSTVPIRAQSQASAPQTSLLPFSKLRSQLPSELV